METYAYNVLDILASVMHLGFYAEISMRRSNIQLHNCRREEEVGFCCWIYSDKNIKCHRKNSEQKLFGCDSNQWVFY